MNKQTAFTFEGTMKKQAPLWVMMSVLLLLVLAACQTDDATPTTEAGAEASATVDVDTVAVSTGVDVVSAEGQVVPLQTANLSFEQGGTVAEILAEPGSAVAAGAPILALDATIQESALAQAEASLAAAQANVTAAEAQLAVAQSGIEQAEAGKQAAEALLALIESGARVEEIAAAERNVAAAEAGITQAAGNRDAVLNLSDSRIQAAEAQLALAQAQLTPLEDGYQRILDACFETPDGNEVCPLYGPVEENTRAQLEAAQANLEAAQRAVEEARAGATPAQQQAAQAAVGVAVAQRNVAQAQLDLLLEGASDEQIKQAEVAVAQADVGIEQAGVAVSQAESAVVQAQAGLVNAEATVEAAQKALDRMTLTAPFDGVVGDITVEVGELAAPGVPVVPFADQSAWLVKTTDLTELDVVSVKAGLPAEIVIDALPGEVIEGEVIEISPAASLVRGDVVYEVTIALSDVADLPLRWGMTAFVDIDVE